MNYIEGYPVLAATREKELIIKAQSGDKEARDIVILSNTGLIRKTATKYTNNGLDIEDLCQIATMGLMKAIPKFDTNKDFRFSTYSVWWITQNLIRTIQNQSRVIRVPVYIFQKNFEILGLQNKLAQELERGSSTEELAEYAGKTKEEIEIFNNSRITLGSLDAKLSDEDSGANTMSDIIADVSFDKFEKINANINTNSMLDIIKNILKDEEYKIFVEHGIKNKTYNEVAESLDVSRAKVQQHYRKIIEKLQRNSKIKMFNVAY